jgi:hypothetical protein
MSNTINELMARLEEDPTLATPGDIDDIVAYQRKARSNHENGIKGPKSAPASKMAADELLGKLGMTAAPTEIKRRA